MRESGLEADGGLKATVHLEGDGFVLVDDALSVVDFAGMVSREHRRAFSNFSRKIATGGAGSREKHGALSRILLQFHEQNIPSQSLLRGEREIVADLHSDSPPHSD